MAITSASRDWGTTGPNIVRITATNTLAEVAAADYVTAQADNLAALNSGVWEWVVGDLIAVAASDGSMFFEFDGDDFTTFITLPIGNGAVVLPVTDKNFVNFDSTLGALQDLGFSASDVTKTKVVMAGSAVVVGAMAKFSDTAGTIDDTSGTATNAGSIQAGASGTTGTLISFPATAANGSLIVAAANAGGAFNTTISNSTMGQSTVYSIPDAANAAGRFLVGATATPFTSGNFPVASGTAGLMVDSGLAASNIVSKISANVFSGSGQITLAKVNGTEASNLVTASGNAGYITTSALTTAAGSTYSVTWTNTKITATSVIGLTIQGGTNTVYAVQFSCVAGSGSATLVIHNIGPTDALNGTIIIGYSVL